MVKEKGIEELVTAFLNLRQKGHRLHLFLIGPFEEHLDPVDIKIKKLMIASNGIHHFGMQDNPENFTIASDLFCLPSYREGFPMVVLEAAALKIPAIVSDVIGCVDTVIKDETGLVFKARSADAIEQTMIKFLNDSSLAKRLGENAYQYVIVNFSNEIYAKYYLKEYDKHYQTI
jgi:glycosyltransferase involved in cell wall biosynthesis